MPEKRSVNHTAVVTFLVLSILAGVLAVAAIGLIDPDPKNAWLFGFSKQRLLLMAATFTGVAALSGFLIVAVRKPSRVEYLLSKISGKSRLVTVLGWLLGVGFLLGLVLTFLPAYRSGALQDYFLRLRPLVIWLTLLLGQLLLLLNFIQHGINMMQWRIRRMNERSLLVISVVAFAVLLLFWLLIALTGLGIQPDSTFWNQAGTPVTGIQLMIAWLIAYILCRIGMVVKPSQQKILNIGVAVFIWLAAVLVWKFSPFFGDYFVSALHAPNFEHYPASDAQVFDISAQFALIGQGYANNSLVSRPFFTFFLTSIYALFGNDMDTIVNAQILIYALTPVALYGLALEYGKRSAGLFAGLILVFMEGNAIATSHIVQRTNARLLMTELPAALMIIGITWLLMRWWRSPESRWGLIPLAGGILGFSTMVRQNTWALLLAIPVFAAIALWRKRRQLGKFVLWFLLGFFAAVAPWMVRSAYTTGNPLYILGPFKYVVWGNRLSNLGAPTATPLAPGMPTAPAPDTTLLAPTESAAGFLTPDPVSTPVPQVTEPPIPPSGGGRVVMLARVVANHFAHNLVASSLVFPPRLLFHDVYHLMEETDSYWQLDWQGKMDAERVTFLVLSLLLIALGIGSAWRQKQMIGLLPLWVGLSYHAGSAIARTSGGRYIVPVEWVIPLYFALGAWLLTMWVVDLFQPVTDGMPEENTPGTPGAGVRDLARRVIQPGWMCVILLAVGILMTTADRFGQPRYEPQTQQRLKQQVLQIAPLQALEGLDTFLESPDVLVLEGSSLYPIHIGVDIYEPAVGDAAPQGEFPMFLTRLIGPRGSRIVALPIESAPKIINTSHVWAIGCDAPSYLDALAVVLWTGGQPEVFLRNPLNTLTCPLPQPVCDQNRNCR